MTRRNLEKRLDGLEKPVMRRLMDAWGVRVRALLDDRERAVFVQYLERAAAERRGGGLLQETGDSEIDSIIAKLKGDPELVRLSGSLYELWETFEP
jgi:hypothetical protein